MSEIGTPGGTEPHRGTIILVFGILSVVFCCIFGIFAWLWGNEDLEKMRQGRMDREGESLTSAGKILGIIGLALQAIGIVLCLLWFLFIGGLVIAGG